MDLSTAFQNIHWIAVIVATLAAFFIGWLWHSPLLFGKVWQKEVGLSQDKMKSGNMPLIFGTTFVLNLIASILMAMFLGKESTLQAGLQAGMFVGIGWVATSFGTTYLFTQKSFRLFLIDAGYYACWYTVIGGILGVWK